MVCIHTENQNQGSFYPFILLEISVLHELPLGHLRFLSFYFFFYFNLLNLFFILFFSFRFALFLVGYFFQPTVFHNMVCPNWDIWISNLQPNSGW